MRIYESQYTGWDERQANSGQEAFIFKNINNFTIEARVRPLLGLSRATFWSLFLKIKK